AARPPWSKVNLPLGWIVPLFSLLAIVGCALVTSFVQGAGPAGRTRDMFYALFIVAWLASLVALSATLNPAPTMSRMNRILGAAGALVLAVGLLTTPATAASLLDLPYALGKFRQAHHARVKAIETASALGNADVLLPPIVPVPSPLQDNGILVD